MIIYILTDGDYSDYYIIGCFSSEELANKFKLLHGTGDIETYELDEIGKNGLFKWIVNFYEYKDNTDYTEVLSIIKFDGPKIGHHYDQYNHFPYKLKIWCEIEAEDKEHAIKIAVDKVAQYKVEHNL